MVTKDNQFQFIDGSFVTNGITFGKSSDTKPTTGVPNAQCFIEIDRSKIYFFDLDTSEWLEWGAQA